MVLRWRPLLCLWPGCRGQRSFSDLTESELRLTSVVAGTITILLFGAAVEMFGFVPSLLAALLFALAPLPVYYDRYFIHESLFCAATFGLILSGWRAVEIGLHEYAALAGACAAFMLACKETAILHLFASGRCSDCVQACGIMRGKAFAASLRLGPLLAGGLRFFGAHRHFVHLVRQKLESPPCSIARGLRLLRARGWSGSSKTRSGITAGFSSAAGPVDCWLRLPASGS